MTIYQVSSYTSTKFCSLIICQCMLAFVTFVVSCPPANPDEPEYSGIYKSSEPPDPPTETTLSDETTEETLKPLPTDLKIIELQTQPGKPDNIEHAWVMICQADSDPFGHCCISNQLWYLEHLPKQKGMQNF